jgi:hypothetical protein
VREFKPHQMNIKKYIPSKVGKYTISFNVNFYSVALLIVITIANVFFLDKWLLFPFAVWFFVSFKLSSPLILREWIIKQVKDGLIELQEEEFKSDLPKDMQDMKLEDFGCVIKTITIINDDNKITIDSMITVIGTDSDDDDDDDDYYPVLDDDLGGKNKRH